MPLIPTIIVDLIMARLVAVLILYSLLGLLGQVQADSSVSPSHSRIELTIPVHVFTNATKIAFDTPRNQTQLTGLLQEAFSVTSNVSVLQIGTIPLNASYQIFGELFVPDNWKENGTGVLEFAVHGYVWQHPVQKQRYQLTIKFRLNLDRTYWSIDGSASPLNYVESSLKAGHAIFVFDRLGSGQSSKPDGIKEVQTAVHIPVIDSVNSFLRNGVQGFSFKTIVGIGHSYGSFLLAALAANVPDALDAIVLTGFTVDTQSANHTAFVQVLHLYSKPAAELHYSGSGLHD
ncbi:hypothetical protein EUX98_g9776 [Antrodiella citrinella]|uniref:AB hydrolase-1 domain-containing protein n=1 Tax=Antrodiella citrinella TaxID=2447956 RepID=A0A4S4LLD2_9APHY|nr:hypothetical protein EUX98_g9776 [Antrodiella citrinella]